MSPLPTPPPDFTWALVSGVLVAVAAVSYAAIRWLLGRFFADLQSRHDLLSGIVARAVEEMKHAIKEVADEKNRAHEGIWKELVALKDRIHALEVQLAKSATADDMHEMRDRIESISRDVHALKTQRGAP